MEVNDELVRQNGNQAAAVMADYISSPFSVVDMRNWLKPLGPEYDNGEGQVRDYVLVNDYKLVKMEGIWIIVKNTTDGATVTKEVDDVTGVISRYIFNGCEPVSVEEAAKITPPILTDYYGPSLTCTCRASLEADSYEEGEIAQCLFRARYPHDGKPQILPMLTPIAYYDFSANGFPLASPDQTEFFVLQQWQTENNDPFVVLHQLELS